MCEKEREGKEQGKNSLGGYRRDVKSRNQEKTGGDVRIKLCGLFRKSDILCANEIMPDYAGFVFAESPRQVTGKQAAAYRRLLNPGIRAVGVFVDAPLGQAAELLGKGVIDLAQLHGTEDEAYIRRLKEETGRPVIKAVRVRSPSDVEAWLSSRADFLLFDGGAGSGKAFDWKLLGDVDRDYFLAGGLTPKNIPEAVERLHPYAVDISSGVETGGVKDPRKMRLAAEAARGRQGKRSP